MKRFKRVLIGLGIVIFIMLVASLGVLRHISRRALPDYTKNLVLDGLRDEVKVFRDSRAVPHIYAKNNHDVYFVTGYLMAQDRLWQMDLLRRVTMGRLSEIFGADMADTDQLLRALRMTNKSAKVFAASDAKLQQSLEAFRDGVNLFIRQNSSKMPPEFALLGYAPEPWHELHTLNLIGYMAWDLASGWQNEVSLYKLGQKLPANFVKELFPTNELQPSYVYPHAGDSLFALLESSNMLDALSLEVFSASNNWAVSGARTSSGKPLLANDMHLGFGLPGIWYQIHQIVEDSLNVSGVALPGAPVVIVGHNEHIAWGMTNLSIDDIDFYKETVNEEDSNLYLFNGEWRPLEVVKENILTGKGDTIVRYNRFTHRGPIVSTFKNTGSDVISMRWIGNEFSNELRAVYQVNRAEDWNDFREAFSSFGAVSQNVVYADINGNIGLQATGTVAIRNDGDAITVYPGDTDQYDWIGFLDFDELPNSYNPPEGMVSSANNRTVGEDYPHYLGTWFDFPARIDRIRELLNEKAVLGIEDFKAIQLDQKSAFAAKYRDEIVDIVAMQTDKSALVEDALNTLKEWDFNLGADDKATLIFENFYIQFLRNILLDEMGESLYNELSRGLQRHIFVYFFDNPESDWIDDIRTAEKESFEDMVYKSFVDALDAITEDLGPSKENWKWGKVHQLWLKHPMGKVKLLDKLFKLNIGPFPIGGSFHTVNPMAYDPRTSFEVNHGASQRHIYDLSDWGASQVMIPTGTSGIPSSKYYGNQVNEFVTGKYYTDIWELDELEKTAKYKAVFSPAK